MKSTPHARALAAFADTCFGPWSNVQVQETTFLCPLSSAVKVQLVTCPVKAPWFLVTCLGSMWLVLFAEGTLFLRQAHIITLDRKNEWQLLPKPEEPLLFRPITLWN